jgi:hypothetical protein
MIKRKDFSKANQEDLVISIYPGGDLLFAHPSPARPYLLRT